MIASRLNPGRKAGWVDFARSIGRLRPMKIYPIFAAILAVGTNPVTVFARQPTPAVPLGNPGTWVTAADYPAGSLGNGENGVVEFLLAVSPRGTVAACSIVGSSGFKALDERTCDLLKARALFRPARDDNGRETAGTYRNRVRWLIPGKPLLIPHYPATAFVESFIVEEDGRISNCEIERNNGGGPHAGPLGEPSVCESGLGSAPYRDAAGKPVRTRVRITRSVELTQIEEK